MSTEQQDDRKEHVLDLNFVPEWVHQPVNPYTQEDFRSKPDKRDRNTKRTRNDRPDRGRPGGGRKPDQRGSRPERRPDRKPQSSRERTPHNRQTEDRDIPGVEVTFIPEQAGAITLVKRITGTGRAYSLFDLASLILSKPAFHAVKVTLKVEKENPALETLHQCSKCRMMFTAPTAAANHAFICQAADYYTVETSEGEPPSGSFNCVVRCSISGSLLGPPNYHGFNDAVRELHRERFSKMSIDDYRRKLDTVHDEALVEEWKTATRTRTTWALKDTETIFDRKRSAEAHFRENYLGKAIRKTTRGIMPGATSVALEASNPLNAAIRAAWGRENRFPLKLSLALRAAFKHNGLHMFKSGDGSRFVTARTPAPIDPATTVQDVRVVLEYLAAHPGCQPKALSSAVGDGSDAALKPLHWLIDRGHVIEFSDGRLAVPKGRPPKS